MADLRRCKAVRDYVAKNDDEITFKEGDIIFVPNRTDGPMWKGVFNGKAGFFPRIYVDDTTVEIKSSGQVARVRATRAYTAENEEQLSFAAGTVMFVAAKVDAKWFKGVHDGKTGLIPAFCVEDASDTDTLRKKTGVETNPAKQFTGLRCRAIRSNLTTKVGELLFKLGDLVFVPKASSDVEQWQGVSNNEIGVFDKNKVMDTAANSKEEIEAVMEANRSIPEEIETAAKVDELREKAKEIISARKGSLSIQAPASIQTVFAVPSPVAEESKPTRAAAADAPAPAAAEPSPAEATPVPPAVGAPPVVGAPPPAAAAPPPADSKPLSEKELKALKKKEETDAKARAKEDEKRAKEEEKRTKEEEKNKEKERKKAEKEAAKKK